MKSQEVEKDPKQVEINETNTCRTEPGGDGVQDPCGEGFQVAGSSGRPP